MKTIANSRGPDIPNHQDSCRSPVGRVAEALRARGCTNVNTGLIEGSNHHVAHEQPRIVEEHVEKYASPQH